MSTIRQYLREYKIHLALLVVPVAFSLFTVLDTPGFLIRAFDSDVTHDYFYKGLLVLDGQLPSGTRHPGTPLAYFMGLLQFVLAGNVADAIRTAGPILDVSSVVLTGVTVLIVGAPLVDVLERDQTFGVISILLLYSIPSYFYFTTQVGPDGLTLAISLALCLVSYWYLIDREGANSTLLGAISGAGLAIKMSLVFVWVPLLVSIIAPVVADTRYVRDFDWVDSSVSHSEAVASAKKYVFTTGVMFFVLTLPDLRNYPRFGYFVMRRFLNKTGGSTDLLQLVGPVITTYAVLSVVALGVLVAVLRWDRERPLPIQLVAFFGMTTLVLIVSLPSIFESGPITPKAFRQVGVVMVPSVWTGTLLVLRLGDESDRNLIGEYSLRQVFVPLFMATLLVSSSYLMVYNHDFVETEYAAGAEANEVMTELAEIDGRVAINKRGVDTTALGATQTVYGPEVVFHLHGNSQHAYGRFEPDLLRIYPNFTSIRWRYPHHMYGTNSTFTFHGRAYEKKPTNARLQRFNELKKSYDRFANTEPHPNSDNGLYVGRERGVRISCLLYPEQAAFGQVDELRASYNVTTEQLNDDFAREAGFRNYTIRTMTVGGPDRPNVQGRYVVICDAEDEDRTADTANRRTGESPTRSRRTS
jgi:hypothetical protein